MSWEKQNVLHGKLACAVEKFSRVEHVERVEVLDRINMINRIEKWIVLNDYRGVCRSATDWG